MKNYNSWMYKYAGNINMDFDPTEHFKTNYLPSLYLAPRKTHLDKLHPMDKDLNALYNDILEKVKSQCLNEIETYVSISDFLSAENSLIMERSFDNKIKTCRAKAWSKYFVHFFDKQTLGSANSRMNALERICNSICYSSSQKVEFYKKEKKKLTKNKNHYYFRPVSFPYAMEHRLLQRIDESEEMADHFYNNRLPNIKFLTSRENPDPKIVEARNRQFDIHFLFFLNEKITFLENNITSEFEPIVPLERIVTLNWNGSKVTLTNILRQLKTLTNKDGKPLLENSYDDVAVFLKQNFNQFRDTQLGTIKKQLKQEPKKASSIITLTQGRSNSSK